MLDTETVVIGAGPAGLATATCLRHAGRPFLLLEQSAAVGQAWRNHYDRLHLHTSKRLSQLPGLAFPRRVPRYPARTQVIEYLEAYARNFELAPRFGERVVSVRREGSTWLTRSEREAFRSSNVVVATGFAHVPVRPSWPGLSSFAGQVLHSSEYRNGAPWRGGRVLVVGIGNSGGEIALDLFECGAHPTLSVRSGVNVVPRDFLGVPILAWGIALGHMPLGLADAIASGVSRVAIGRLEPLGLHRPPYGPMRQIGSTGHIPLLDIGTVASIRRGEIAVRGGVEAFTREGARFVGRAAAEPFDAVVLATGYRPGLAAFLEAPEALGADEVPRGGALPGLYFCGFHVVATGMLREIAIEARQIAGEIARA